MQLIDVRFFASSCSCSSAPTVNIMKSHKTANSLLIFQLPSGESGNYYDYILYPLKQRWRRLKKSNETIAATASTLIDFSKGRTKGDSRREAPPPPLHRHKLKRTELRREESAFVHWPLESLNWPTNIGNNQLNHSAVGGGGRRRRHWR